MRVVRTPKPDPIGSWLKFTGEESDLCINGVGQRRYAKGLASLGCAYAIGEPSGQKKQKQGHDLSVMPLSHVNKQADGYTLFGPDWN
jgi:hypothetical protein